MTIKFNKNTREFHLYNNEISYIINIMKNNQLGQLYFGKNIKDRDSFEHLYEAKPRPLSAGAFEGDSTFSLEHTKQEYPSYGTTDFRYPAYSIKLKNGSRITNFEYVSHNIFMGKKELKGLPATYVEVDSEATTLEIKLQDSVINSELILSYTIFENYPAIARSAKFINNSSNEIDITNAMSLNLDLPDSEYEMLQLSGAWSRERYIKFRHLEQGVQSVYSLRGASSSQHNPFIALKKPNTDENIGVAIGVSLVYSGNFLAEVEVDTYNTSRVRMGINPYDFSWRLKNREEFQTPEAILVYSDSGMNKMSQTLHNLYRTRLARGEWRDKGRPILINNWEATSFNFNEEKILNIAKKASDIGVELFVLDDGWFGERNDDTRGLGDWVPNLNKLPNGIRGLSNKIEELGMKFGLWFEPEMVNKDSDLYRNHPEWIISDPNRRESQGRNQYVLDFSIKEVVDCVYDMMYKILVESKISYIKWDMNRYITECYSKALSAENQGEVFHRYILGVYDLYERLISKFPHVLFESCASGGARFDPGMLYYAPQAWTSDDTDAIERLKIQYGTSMVYPISSMGAHVSEAPNQQVFRDTSIETRFNVACFGAFGYELDLNELSKEEERKVRKQVEFVKEYRDLIQKGTFYRLKSPFEGNIVAWSVVSEDKKEALVGYYKILTSVNTEFTRVKLKGLDENIQYHISESNSIHYGDELMNVGLITTDSSAGQVFEPSRELVGDFTSKIYILKAI